MAHWSGVSIGNLDNMQSVLSRLTLYFASAAWAELRGCEVGQGSDGEELLKGLARIWRVPVQGGTLTQYHANWDGLVVEASPNGAMRSIIGTAIQQAANLAAVVSR